MITKKLNWVILAGAIQDSTWIAPFIHWHKNAYNSIRVR
jgi:hypothetical protein